MFRIYRFGCSVNDVVVDAVFDVGCSVFAAKQSPGVGLVFREQEFGRAFAVQPAVAKPLIIQFDHRIWRRADLMQFGTRLTASPRPHVPEPHSWQQPQRGNVRTTIRYRDLDQNIFRISLGVLHEHVEITVVIEYPGVQQFVFCLVFASAPILFDQPGVGKLRLRIFVQILHVGMRRRTVEIEVVLFYVLAMVAFVAGEAENSFFKNWIPLVPQSQGKADHLPAVADPRQSVLVPAIGPRTGMVMGQTLPGIAVRTVVLADRAPRAFAEVRAPALPMFIARSGLCQPDLFLCHGTTIPEKTNGIVSAARLKKCEAGVEREDLRLYELVWENKDSPRQFRGERLLAIIST